jgi:hypothetical protein
VVELLPIAVVPQPDGSIVASRDEAVIQGRNCEVIELAGVEGEDEISLISLWMILPKGAQGIFHNPIIIFDLDPVDIGRPLILRFKVNFLFGLDVEVEFLIRFSLIYRLRIPEPDVSISSSSDDLLVVMPHEFDVSCVAGSFGVDRNHRFNQIAFPK